jgi:hypothetical protein
MALKSLRAEETTPMKTNMRQKRTLTMDIRYVWDAAAPALTLTRDPNSIERWTVIVHGPVRPVLRAARAAIEQLSREQAEREVRE